MISRQIDISQSGKLWLFLAAGLVLLYIVWQLGDSISTGSWKFAAIVAAGFFATFVASQIAQNWRTGVYYFLFWVLFEDLFRKYMGNNMAIYFAKDILAAVTFGSFIVSRMRERFKPFHPPFRFVLGAFVILGAVQMLNPYSPSVWYGILGMKLYFYYMPLMFVGYAMFKDESDLPKFFSFNMIIGGAIAAVGVFQTAVNFDFLNPKGSADIDDLSHMTRFTHGGLAVLRAPSIFVSEGRFQSYMLIAFVLGLGGAGYLLLRSKRGRVFVFPGLGLVAVGGLMTGSRGVFVYTIATAILLASAMIWGAPAGKAAGNSLVKAIRRSFVFIAIAVVLLVTIFPASILPRIQFYQETLMPNSEYSELGSRTWQYPIDNLMAAMADPHWIVGHGIGTASLGAQYVTRIMGVPRPNIGVEEGFGQILLELGILGPLLWLLWAGSLVAAALNLTLKLKGTWAFPIAVSILWYAFLLLFPLTWGGLAQYQNFVSNAFLWLFVGILFKLPEMVKQSKEKQEAIAAAIR